jgi:hypothetical protein
VRFRPQHPHACALTIGVISDTLFPFHFPLGELNRIAAAVGFTLSRAVPAGVPLFLNHRGEVSPEDLVAICRAVAAARITLDLGIIREILWAAEGWIFVPPGLRPLHLHGISGPMRLVKLARWCGYGTIYTPQFAPWV